MPIRTRDLWSRLPDAVQVRAIFQSFDAFIAADGEPPTPYHFTLEVLGSLYMALVGSGKPTANGRKRQPLYKKAMASSLRAIAYFSWERTAQVFLTRRVYPVYFDFLSYSHVPAGWGALGLMLKELEHDGRGYRDRVYTTVPDIRRDRILFPYLREATRLKYGAVLVLPIFDEPEPGHPTLLGACAFYLRDESVLPERAEVKKRLSVFAQEMAKAISRHELRINDAELSKNWHRGLRVGQNYLAELQLRIHPEGRAEVLDEITDEIVRSLSGHDLCCIPDPSREGADRKSRTIMIAARDGIEPKTVRKQVLSAVGHACDLAEGNPYVSCRLNVAALDR
jgi:hypothetical protein